MVISNGVYFVNCNNYKNIGFFVKNRRIFIDMNVNNARISDICTIMDLKMQYKKSLNWIPVIRINGFDYLLKNLQNSPYADCLVSDFLKIFYCSYNVLWPRVSDFIKPLYITPDLTKNVAWVWRDAVCTGFVYPVFKKQETYYRFVTKETNETLIYSPVVPGQWLIRLLTNQSIS